MQEQSSLLPELVSLSGVGIGFCVAYLALDKFRYRTLVEQHAKDAFEKTDLNPYDLSPEIKWERTLLRFSGYLEEVQKARRDNYTGDNQEIEIKEKLGFWEKFYSLFFIKCVDRWLVGLATAFSCFVTILGTAHNFGYLFSDHFLFGSDYIHFWFWIVVFCGCLPPFWVIVGRFSVSSTCEYITDMLMTYEAMAKKAMETVINSECRDP